MNFYNQEKVLTAIAFDDGFFVPKKSRKALLVGIVMRSTNQVDGLLSDYISVDGFNSSEKIISLIKNSRFKENISLIFLSGINFAGFNIVDVEKIYAELKVPVIIVFRKMPKMNEIEKALQHLSFSKKRISFIKKAGEVYSAQGIKFQCIGISSEYAVKLLKKFSYYSNLPEPLRLVHLIASGISIGESTAP